MPEKFGLPYRLQGLAGASLARTAVASLKKKGADCNYISEICNAAEHESGNQMSWVTKALASRNTEKRFHQFFSKSLPKVSTIVLPLVTSKKKKTVVLKPCRIFVQLRALLVLNPEAQKPLPISYWGSIQGIVLPSSYMSWLQKRPWILQAICFGTSTYEERKLLLGSGI